MIKRRVVLVWLAGTIAAGCSGGEDSPAIDAGVAAESGGAIAPSATDAPAAAETSAADGSASFDGVSAAEAPEVAGADLPHADTKAIEVDSGRDADAVRAEGSAREAGGQDASQDAGGDALAASDAAPEAPGPARLEISPTQHSFGMSDFCMMKEVRILVRNAGGASTGPLTVTLSSPTPRNFPVTADRCSQVTLAGGATCEIVVRFAPSVDGEIQATVGVNASPGGRATVALKGTGHHIDSLSFKQGFADFGSIPVGQASSPMVVTAFHNGPYPWTRMTASISGAHRDDFTIAENRCPQEGPPPGGECDMLVRFTPRAEGPRSASLLVFYDGCDSGAAGFSLTGTGK